MFTDAIIFRKQLFTFINDTIRLFTFLCMCPIFVANFNALPEIQIMNRLHWTLDRHLPTGLKTQRLSMHINKKAKERCFSNFLIAQVKDIYPKYYKRLVFFHIVMDKTNKGIPRFLQFRFLRFSTYRGL